MPLSDGAKARIALEADFLNTLAGNIFALGVIAPIVSYAFGIIIPEDRMNLALACGFLCIAVGLGLHLKASALLRRLDE